MCVETSTLSGRRTGCELRAGLDNDENMHVVGAEVGKLATDGKEFPPDMDEATVAETAKGGGADIEAPRRLGMAPVDAA